MTQPVENTSRYTSVTTSTQPEGIVLTFQNISVFLGILVSLSVLSTIVIRLITSQNKVSTAIDQIEKALKEYAANFDKLREVERTLDFHVRDYTNQNKILQLVLEQTNQKSEDKIQRLQLEVKEMQSFLKRDLKFVIRNKNEAE